MTSMLRAAELAARLELPQPTPEQTRIIEAPLEPLLVIAGAGSGKTETMAARVVYLVANGLVRAEEVLGLTFTRKAAAELAVRIRGRLHHLATAGVGPRPGLSDQPRIATYNSYAASLLTDHGLRLGADPDATVITDAARFQIAEELVRTWPLDLLTHYKPGTVIAAVTALAGELSEHDVQPEQAAELLGDLASDFTEVEGRQSQAYLKPAESLQLRARLMDLVAAFQQAKRSAGVVDFADQVRLAAHVAGQVPAVGAVERSRYRVVLLDEYQDTSVAQVQMLAALFTDGHPVTAVGDPNQAIYGWRGAAAGTLLSFPDAFRTGERKPAEVATLSTAWRNDHAILDVANHIAAPLRTGAASRVPPLRPSPSAASGTVLARIAETSADEAALIARLLTEHWSADAAAPVSAAVLCRKRSQFQAIEGALTGAGLPCQVVGLGGLLFTAEVADIRAALTVAHDPSRGDAMMRLLTGPSVHLGAQDLAVLSAWSRVQAPGPRRAVGPQGSRGAGTQEALGRDARDAPASADVRAAGAQDALGAQAADPHGQEPLAEDAEQVAEDAEQASITEAVDSLPRREWTDQRGRSLSDAAYQRLQQLSAQLRQIRSLGYLAIPELITATEQILGLDIEVIAAVPGSVAHARRNLDAFTTAGAQFAGGTADPTLAAFLAYLDAVEDEENGLDLMVAEPDPTAIQIMTVHAAKGLEWDTVVVAGMNAKDFPAVAPKSDGHYAETGWLTNPRTLPYSLRGDCDWLPELPIAGAASVADVSTAVTEFRRAEGERQLTEERRLAYVAMTRARHVLILTAHYWGTRSTLNTPSVFLQSLLDAGLADTGSQWISASQHEHNPLTDATESSSWPQPAHQVAKVWDDLWREAAEEPIPAPDTSAWWREAELLLAERELRSRPEFAMPDHLAASAMVDLARDPEQFWRSQRRPIPRRPSVAARRGTRFHTWVEQYYGAQTLLDFDSLPGAQDGDADAPLAELQEAFLNSSWANLNPITLEVDIETMLGSVAVRCRIDAVFAEGQGVHIVDWKTGRPPRDRNARTASQVQLALYRLAWSRLHDVPIEHIAASLHYVGDDVTISADELSEAELTALLATPPGAQALAQVAAI